MGQSSHGNTGPSAASTRRQFLRKGGETALLGAAFGPAPFRQVLADFTMLQDVPNDVNPLGSYPNRNWEQVYRDLYTPDQTYHYMGDRTTPTGAC